MSGKPLQGKTRRSDLKVDSGSCIAGIEAAAVLWQAFAALYVFAELGLIPVVSEIRRICERAIAVQ